MNFRNKAVLLFASGCGVGYFPVAPGTFGSLVGLAICFGLALFTLWVTIFLTVILIFLAVWVANEAEKVLAQKDPGKIVIDEIAGMAVALIGIPFTVVNASLAFFLFRIYDIAKPFPIRIIDQKLPGGIGVVMDDVLAGVYGNLTLRLLLSLIPALG